MKDVFRHIASVLPFDGMGDEIIVEPRSAVLLPLPMRFVIIWRWLAVDPGWISKRDGDRFGHVARFVRMITERGEDSPQTSSQLSWH